MCNKEYLIQLQKRVKEVISFTPKNNKDIIDKENLITNLNQLTPNDKCFVYRINDKFVYFENIHIVDLVRLRQETEDANISDDIKEILQFFIEKLEKFDDIKTKKQDKLYTICPAIIDEYCPMCSIRLLSKIDNFDLLNNPDTNLSPDIIKFVSDLGIMFDIINNNIYMIKNALIPAIIYYHHINEYKLKIIKLNKNEAEMILSTLISYLKENTHYSIGDINMFSFTLTEKENDDSINIKIEYTDEYDLEKNNKDYDMIVALKNQLIRLNIYNFIKVKTDWIKEFSEISSQFISKLKQKLDEHSLD